MQSEEVMSVVDSPSKEFVDAAMNIAEPLNESKSMQSLELARLSGEIKRQPKANQPTSLLYTKIEPNLMGEKKKTAEFLHENSSEVNNEEADIFTSKRNSIVKIEESQEFIPRPT